ncbi:MAG: ABC transporter permease [Planctomycetota bacterium]
MRTLSERLTRFRLAAAELLAELRRHRTRTLLSLSAVAWGSFAILVLLAFSVGMQDLFERRSRGIGDGVAIAWPQRTSRPWQGLPAGRPLSFTRDDVLAVGAAVPTIDAISAEIRAQGRAEVAGQVVRVALCGVEPEYATLRALRAASGGRFLSPADIDERRRVVFLGDALARRLFGSGDPIGRSVRFGAAPWLVIGVLEAKEQDSDYGGLDADLAFVPVTSLSAATGTRAVRDIVFRAADPSRQAECTAQIVAALAARARFDPRDRQALSVWDTTEQQRMLGAIFLAFHVVLALAGVITLGAGIVGVAHLMFLVVRRRTAEIGLALAVGARPVQIRGEILRQTVALVLAGGACGVVLAVVAVAVAARAPFVSETGEPRIPWLLGVGAVLILLLAGFVAGVVPARRAARLDPVLALRGSDA